MKLIIVRHGETQENVARIIQGQLDGKLSQQGIVQAQKVAQRLQHENIDVAYISDLGRTKDTAAHILQYHPHTKIVYEKALRERSWGVWEGKKRDERNAFLEKTEQTFTSFHPQGGETFAAVEKRLSAFYTALLQKHKKGTVLLVGHGGAFTILYLSLFKKSIEDYKNYHPGNGAVTVLEIDDNEKHTVHVLNCVKHLELLHVKEEFEKLSKDIEKKFKKQNVMPEDVDEAVKWARKK